MKLRYIALNFKAESYDKYSIWFSFHVQFINDYLSRRIRQYKFDTNGEFNQICIEVGSQKEPHIHFLGNLVVGVPFILKEYEDAVMSDNYDYYLNLFRLGFEKANSFRNIPYQELIKFLDEFKNNNYENSWRMNYKIFRELNIKLELIGHYTTDAFICSIHFLSFPQKDEICSGVLFATKPDDIYFTKIFRDIVSDGQKLYFIDYYENNTLIEIDLNKIKSSQFNYSYIIPPEIMDDSKLMETRVYNIKSLSYKPVRHRLIQEIDYNL